MDELQAMLSEAEDETLEAHKEVLLAEVALAQKKAVRDTYLHKVRRLRIALGLNAETGEPRKPRTPKAAAPTLAGAEAGGEGE
jgi:hypothetical protein